MDITKQCKRWLLPNEFLSRFNSIRFGSFSFFCLKMLLLKTKTCHNVFYFSFQQGLLLLILTLLLNKKVIIRSINVWIDFKITYKRVNKALIISFCYSFVVVVVAESIQRRLKVINCLFAFYIRNKKKSV